MASEEVLDSLKGSQKELAASSEDVVENREGGKEEEATEEAGTANNVSQRKAEEEGRKEASKAEADDNANSSDQSSPRGVLENLNSCLDSDSSSSSCSSCSSESLLTNFPWRSLISTFLWRRKRPMKRMSSFPLAKERSGLQSIEYCSKDPMEGGRFPPLARIGRPSWRSFDYQELAAATDNFSPDNQIGKGGHAEVYKGCLPDGQLIAVKRLTKGRTEEEKIRDFLSELGIIAHIDHPNAAQLLGFSVEGGLHLVLQFSPHGSLSSLLHGSSKPPDWQVRFKIALGIAEGLLYLHEGCNRRIIHRDIKASNILLAQDYQPQISDFGLAKWLPDKWTHHTVFPIEGTFGYLAPEYFMHGVLNEKTDVFAFGVLLLELITGRRAVDSSRHSLVIWATPLLNANNIKDLVDPSLHEAYDPVEMKRLVSAAALSIHHLSTARPNMNWVVRLLKGEVPELVARAQRIGSRKTPLFDAGDLEDYTCSRYLNDLNRHKQLALEQ